MAEQASRSFAQAPRRALGQFLDSLLQPSERRYDHTTIVPYISIILHFIFHLSTFPSIYPSLLNDLSIDLSFSLSNERHDRTPNRSRDLLIGMCAFTISQAPVASAECLRSAPSSLAHDEVTPLPLTAS